MISSMQRVETPQSASLAYRRRKGPGPLVVFSHPHSADQRLFDDLLSHWHGNALSWDRQGYGASTKGRCSARQEQDLTTILDHVEAQKVVLFGLAAGGAVSLAFAQQWPDRVAGLVLVSSFLGQPASFWQEKTGETLPRGDAAERELSARFRASPAAALWHRRQAHLEGSGAGEPPQAVNVSLDAPPGTPLFLATGAEDLLFTPAMLNVAARLLPDASCELLPSVAHAAPAEDPHATADYLTRCLAEIAARRSIPR